MTTARPREFLEVLFLEAAFLAKLAEDGLDHIRFLPAVHHAADARVVAAGLVVVSGLTQRDEHTLLARFGPCEHERCERQGSREGFVAETVSELEGFGADEVAVAYARIDLHDKFVANLVGFHEPVARGFQIVRPRLEASTEVVLPSSFDERFGFLRAPHGVPDDLRAYPIRRKGSRRQDVKELLHAAPSFPSDVRKCPSVLSRIGHFVNGSAADGPTSA